MNLDALKAVARERPKNPVEFFSFYLLTTHAKEHEWIYIKAGYIY